MGKKKTTKEGIELAKLSKQLKEFISDSVDGMSIHEGILVMCVADAYMLHEFALNAVGDEEDVDEYFSTLDAFTDYYTKKLKSAIDVVVLKDTKENVKVSNHGKRKSN